MSAIEAAIGVSSEWQAWATEPSSSTLPSAPLEEFLCVDCPREARQPATSSCLKCNHVYCDACWAHRRPHMRGDSGHDRVPIHGSQMEDLTPVYRRLEQVFYPAPTTAVEDNQQHQQHLNVMETLWLAVTSSDDTHCGSLSFDERSRFDDLMGEHQRLVQPQLENKNLVYYPRLISFNGNTGVGKSSLIEVLMGHLWDSSTADQDRHGILVPVAGNATGTLPTSSDIHLYHDQHEAKKNPQFPLLFADCEGFEAANYSAASKSRAQHVKTKESDAPDHVKEDPTKLKEWTKIVFDTTMNFLKRTLEWSDSKIDRSKAIAELFPRLVYNISDVVVYVVAETNLKSMGRVLEKLIEWSQKAEMSVVNRASLPSLIILINQCDPAKTKEWSSDKATHRILEENAYLMQENKTITNRRDELARFELPHKSIKDILENSYAAVKILQLPTAKDTSQLRKQFQELYGMIESLTNDTHRIKKDNNMLLSPEHLRHLYKLTFDHFSKSTKPFDFIEAFFEVHPSPAKLSDNFFQLLQATFKAIKQKYHTSNHQTFAEELIAATIPLICSTIAMDSRRRQFPGFLFNIFRGDTSEVPSCNNKVRDNSYEETVQGVLHKVADSILPCGHTFSDSSSAEGMICVNGRRAHNYPGSKGWHQDANGVCFGFGSFDASFEDCFRDQWAYALAQGIDHLNIMELPDLWDLHRRNIRALHNLVPKVNLERLPCCVWCMQNFPTERLSCGHWICSSCVIKIGSVAEEDDRVFIVRFCDQHPEAAQELDPPLEFLHLPETIGRRLLSLDEGGVRGILQLKLLDAVQNQLGKEITVKDCFDLIGGTGIGGINALGLGINGWDIPDAIRKFNSLVPQVFTRQSGFASWIPGWAAPPYSLANLIRSIEDAFGEDLQGSMSASLSCRTENGSGPTRVFVTSTRKESERILLSNYRRKATDDSQDQDFKESQNNRAKPNCAEIYSVCEAAKATASFEPFFGSCKVNPGNETHAGGAPDFVCPAKVTLDEAESLWPHVRSPPDVLVSVGCGHNALGTLASSIACTGAGAIWDNEFGEKAQKEPDRYIRLCPEFSETSPLPSADDISVLTDISLQEQALGQDDLRGQVKRVTRRLISTIFYFDKTSSELHESGGTISGHIRCRFKETSKTIKSFGRKISSLNNPRFVSGSNDLWSFSEDVLKVMVQQGRFRVLLSIQVHSEAELNIRFMADDFPSSESISSS